MLDGVLLVLPCGFAGCLDGLLFDIEGDVAEVLCGVDDRDDAECAGLHGVRVVWG